jgi:hypothetical protein
MPMLSSAPAPRRRWIVGVLGGSQQRGSWRLPERVGVVAVLGGAELDLRQADLPPEGARITAFALLGGVKLIAPPDLPMELSGLSLLGGRADERPARTPSAAAPTVHVRAVAILGGVSIRAGTDEKG